MKILKLKKLGEFDYKTNLESILKSAPAEGLTVDDVRKAVKALEALSEAKETVEFEDDIASYVKQRIENSKFVMASKELMEFLDDIINSL